VVQQEVKKATNKLLVLQDEHGKFNDTTYNTINKTLKLYNHHRVFLKRKHVLNQLAKYLHEKEMLPAITFIFSRKLVEACAHEITVPLLEFDSKIPYTVKNECDQIIRKLPNYKEYLELPEYVNLVKLLEKGIGIHHSGMIPVLREIVELMISKKYIKLLFATESFAIGLDCPIKTAVFSNVSKFDGTSERFLMAHEYTQMAGRAGRRGIDTIGNVVHCNNLFNLPSNYEYKKMLNGKPQQLVSKFHISFDLIFNLLKNGQTKDFHLFSNKSMIKNELDSDEKYHQELLEQTKLEVEQKKSAVSVFSASEEIIQKYIDLQDKENSGRQNARRKIQDQMKEIEKEHANIKSEIENYNFLIKKQKQIYTIENDINHVQNYLKTTTEAMCDLLIQKEFIQKEGDEYSFTNRGIIASNIAEVHPLIMTEIIENTNYFENFEPEQIVGLLSCFTDIKVPDDCRSSLAHVQDLDLISILKKTEDKCFEYTELETDYYVNSGYNYDMLKYDILQFSINWCKCKEDTDCKLIFQELSEIPISVGDFNKALLKTVNIVRECINVFEIINRVDVLHKLKQIEPMILKYVTTNQSLYV
jgi:superfamily II RNA helicase